jgi:DNA-binding MarR family transcriptional regulator
MATQIEPETIDWLFVQVCRLHYSRAHIILEEIGLYRGQPPVLRHLHIQDGLTQTELGQRLEVSPATVTKMIQRMEKAGFVQRRQDEADQRVSRVYLTQAGRAIKAEMAARLKTIEAEAFAGFSLDERVIMRRLLLQMRDNLQKVVDENVTF